MPSSPTPFFRRRWVRWTLVAFAVFSLLGFFVAPVIVKSQLVKHASAALKRPVAVDTVRVNPWALSLTIRGLRVTDHDDTELAGFDEFYANFEASSLFRGEFHFGEIRLLHPRGRVVVAANGTLNIADLVPPPAAQPAAPPAKAPALGIERLEIVGGEFTYADHARSGKFETKLGPTTFELVRFTTRPKRPGAYAFAATTESGERLAWGGDVSVNPLGSSGRLGIFDLALGKYAPFHRDFVASDVLDGRLSIEGDYTVDLSGDAPAARLHHGTVKLVNLKVAARDAKEPFLTLPLLQVDGIEADTSRQEAAVASVLVRDLTLTATRRADGTIDAQEWLTPKLPAPAGTPSPEGPAWRATLGRFALENATVKATDLTLPRPVNLTLDQLRVTATGAGTKLDQPVQLATHFRWNEKGTVDVAGTVQPAPLKADLKLDVAGVELRPLDPFIAPFLNVLVTSGAVRTSGQLTASQSAAGAPLLAHFEGDAGLADFATLDAERTEPFASVADVAIRQLRFDLSPLAVQVGEIAIKQPAARVGIDAEGKINLLAALRKSAPAAAASAAPTPAAKAPPPPVKIDRLVIEGGRFALADASVSPAFATELNEFGGTIAGLSSEQLARADVDLSGKLGFAPLRVTGKINPLSGDAFTDLKVTFTGIELPPFTPYSGKFVAYTIDKGKLSLDLTYKLSSRELVGENKVVLDQFYLGSNVESPGAMHLPLKLALAILRERDGRIPIDIPVRGNLDDPDFKYGAFVWHAVGNLITKAATAPFALLGGLFGGGKDLSAVDFAAGGTELDAEAVSRLDGLAKALTERPGLSLEIDSRPQPAIDDAPVREGKLLAQLKARKVRALAQGTTENVAVDSIVLTPEETERLTAEFFAEAFPEPAAAAPVPAAAAGQPAPAPEVAPAARTVRRVVGGGKSTRTTTIASPGAPPPAAAAAATAPGAANAAVASGPSPAEQRARLLARVEITPADFAALATRRAQAIQEYLLNVGKVDAARVFITPSTEAAPPTERPRVVFVLK